MLRALPAACLLALLLPAAAWAPPRYANLVARIAVSAEPHAGEVVVVTASVQNKGPDSVLGGTLVATVPEGLTLLAARPTQGRCAVAGQRVTCAFGLLGRFNQAFDHVASVRMLARAERAGSFDVPTEVFDETSVDTIPENNTVIRPVAVGAATGSHARGLVKLLSATPRKFVVRVTGLGPSPLQYVVVGSRSVGTVEPGVEHTQTQYFLKPARRYDVVVRWEGGGTRLAVRL